MIFRIKTNRDIIDISKISLYHGARRIICLLPLNSRDLKLDRYLRNKYNLSLRSTCLLLLKKAKFNTNLDNEIVITFPTKELDNLATLITYGNGVLQGSDILKYAFRRK